MLLVQTVQPGSDLIRQGIQISEDVAESWNSLWETAIDPSGGLWGGLVNLALFIVAVSVVIIAIKEANEFQQNASWARLVEVFIWPLIVVFFLAANGTVLAQSVLAIRAIGQEQVTSVLDYQLGGATFREALLQLRNNNLAATRVNEIYGSCYNLGEPEFSECIQDPQKQEQATQELEKIENNGSIQTDLDPARKLLDGILRLTPVGAVTNAQGIVEAGGIKQFLQTEIMDLVMLILYALQWAFVNTLEASLLLTALFAPVALGLSMLPVAGKPIFAWFSGFISLIGMQLGYNIVIGIGATVVTEADAELAADLAFLIFIAIFSPILAVAIAGGGGAALFQAISRNSAALTSKAASTVSSLVLLPVKFFI